MQNVVHSLNCNKLQRQLSRAETPVQNQMM